MRMFKKKMSNKTDNLSDKTDLAISKRFLTSFSDSPSHLLTRSELDTEKKVELLAWNK